jgi:hypothetical protein
LNDHPNPLISNLLETLMADPFFRPAPGDDLWFGGPSENAACEPTQRVQPEWRPIHAVPLPIDVEPFALTWDYIIPSIALVDGSTFCPV